MTPEGKVKALAKRIMEPYKPLLYAHWPVQNGMGDPTLDCDGAICGQAFSVETKAPGEELTARQEQTANKKRAAGIRVFVFHGYTHEQVELKKFFDYWQARGTVEHGIPAFLKA